MRNPSILLSFMVAPLLMSSIPGYASESDSLVARRAVVSSSACPVELSAEQASNQTLALAGKPGESGTSPYAQQAIDLSIKNSRLARIVGAELEVHGTGPRAHSLRTDKAAQSTPMSNAVRTVHLEGSVPANQQRTHRLSVEWLTSVQWISIIELRYADGSVWHSGPGRECRVEPNPVMPVKEQALAK